MLILYLIVGAITGLLSGLLGVGGGIIVVPALSMLFLKNQNIPAVDSMHMAIGTSLAIMVLTSLSGLYAYHRLTAVRWDIVKRITPSLLIGTLLGSTIASALSSHYLQLFFAVFLCVVGWRMWLSVPKQEADVSMSGRMMMMVASLIGVLSSILGIGGGTMFVPFFLRCRATLIESMGTSLACGMIVGIAATISFAAHGTKLTAMIPGSTGYIYWPAFLGVAIASVLCAPIGSAIACKLPTALLKKIFAVVLFFIASDMLWMFFAGGEGVR